MIRTSLLLALSAGASALAATTNAPPAAAALPDVVVTPTRGAASAADLPFVSAALDGRALQTERMVRTTPEALRDIPAVNVQKTAQGQGSPYIRGFTGYHTLFLVDGIRLNNSTFRSGPNQYWSTVDSFSIDRLELLKGAAGAQYGSDAVGGVAQAISADPFSLAAGDGLYGRAHYRFSSAERSHMGRLEGAFAEGDVAARAGFSYKDFGDVESGGDAGRLPTTGYEEWAGDAAVAVRLAPNLRLDLVHQSVAQDDVWRTHSTPFAKPFHGSKVGSDPVRRLDQERQLTYARLSATGLRGAVKEASGTASWQEQNESEYRVRKDLSSNRQGVDVSTFGLQGQARMDAGATSLTFGGDYYRDVVDSFNHKQSAPGAAVKKGIQGPVADDADYDLVGVFAQDEFPLGASVRGLAGARYTHAAVDAGRFENPATKEADAFDDSWDDLSLMGRLIWDLAPRASLFGGVSQGFRAPNLSDLTRFDIARSGEVEVPSTSLDPEKFITYEVGLRGGNAGTAQGEVAFFHTDIQDLVDRVPTGETTADGALVRKVNSGEGYVRGVEASGSLPLGGGLLLRGDVVWMEGELDTYASSEPVLSTEPLSRVMPVTGHVALRYQPGAAWWVEAQATVAGKQDKLSPGDIRDTERIPPGGSPSYEVFTLRGGAALTGKLNLTLAVENLLDEEYRPLGSGVNEPGLNFVAAVDARF